MTICRNTRNRAALVGGLLLWGMISVVGCAPVHTDYEAFVRDPRPIVTSTDYRLAPPDQIQITSKRVREINGHRETIRPDGKITLPLLGSVFVANKTLEQVSAELEAMAQQYYEDADVSVRVMRFASKKIFVFGEVTIPGAYSYDGANTVLETLAQAYPTRLADPDRILVCRPGKDGELIHRMTVSLNDMVQGGDVTLDAVLEEGDVIYVPPNPLAAVGLALQQVLLPIQPAANVVRGPASIGEDLSGTTYGRDSGE